MGGVLWGGVLINSLDLFSYFFNQSRFAVGSRYHSIHIKLRRTADRNYYLESPHEKS